MKINEKDRAPGAVPFWVCNRFWKVIKVVMRLYEVLYEENCFDFVCVSGRYSAESGYSLLSASACSALVVRIGGRVAAGFSLSGQPGRCMAFIAGCSDRMRARLRCLFHVAAVCRAVL